MLLTNEFPRSDTERMLLVVPRFHLIDVEDLSLHDSRGMWALAKAGRKRHGFTGGGLVMRTGDPRDHAGTIEHLHLNLIQPKREMDVRLLWPRASRDATATGRTMSASASSSGQSTSGAEWDGCSLEKALRRHSRKRCELRGIRGDAYCVTPLLLNGMRYSTVMQNSRVSIIAAVGKNRELGKDGKLLWHIREDMRRFKALTTGHPVIMGRKTWESLPEKFRPLPGRTNIVVTRQADYKARGAVVADSFETARVARSARGRRE